MRTSAWIVAQWIVRISLVVEETASRGRFRDETAKRRTLPSSAVRFVLFVVIFVQHRPCPIKMIMPKKLLT